MKKQSIKKVFALVTGSLLIALVVSILPGGFLVNAERVSARAAKKAVLEYINDDSAKIVELDDKGLDDEVPIYKIKVKTDTSEYVVEVDAKTAETKLNSRKRLDDNTVVALEDFEDFDEFKEFLEDDDYDDFGIDKPTAQAELNQVIQEGKKLAIADYKEAKDNLDKKDEDYKELKTEAKEEFKASKDSLKEIKKDAQAEIKETKKQDNNSNIEDDEDDDKKLVNTVKIDEKQALLIALDKIGITIDNEAVKDLEATNSIKKYRDIFDLEKLEIEMDDDNPPAYEIEVETIDYKYEIIIHATSGKVLDYEREAFIQDKNNDKKVKEEKDDVDDKDDEDDNKDDKKNNKDNNGNNNNGNNDKDKSNNGKGNNK